MLGGQQIPEYTELHMHYTDLNMPMLVYIRDEKDSECNRCKGLKGLFRHQKDAIEAQMDININIGNDSSCGIRKYRS